MLYGTLAFYSYAVVVSVIPQRTQRFFLITYLSDRSSMRYREDRGTEMINITFL
jgi:hypothetical protein